jgi:hypothetical protein
MKKISHANDFFRSKFGSYDWVLLDGTRTYEYTRWSNNIKTLEREMTRIRKINPELEDRLIIVKTQIEDF